MAGAARAGFAAAEGGEAQSPTAVIKELGVDDDCNQVVRHDRLDDLRDEASWPPRALAWRAVVSGAPMPRPAVCLPVIVWLIAVLAAPSFVLAAAPGDRDQQGRSCKPASRPHGGDRKPVRVKRPACGGSGRPRPEPSASPRDAVRSPAPGRAWFEDHHVKGAGLIER